MSKNIAVKSSRINLRQAKYYFGRSILVWLCSAFFYAIQFIIRVSPNATANDMMADLKIDGFMLGTVISFYYYGYSLMQIPSGLILDRFGIKRPLLIGCLLCAVGCIMFALSSNLVILSLARLLMGIGSAFGFLSNIKVASLWFPENKMSLVIGLTVSFGTLGAIIAGVPFSLLVNHFGWQYSILFLAGFSFILAGFIQMYVVDKKKVKQMDSHVVQPLFKDVKLILKNRSTWLLGLYGFLMYLPIAGFADLWGASFFESKYALDRVQATFITSWFYIGVGVGAPLWSAVLVYFKDYRPTLILAAVISTIFYALGIYIYIDWMPLLIITFFIFGMAAGGQFLAFAAIAQINLNHRVGFATGLQNMLCMLSGIIQPAIGFILDVSDPVVESISDIKHYSVSAYENGLSIVTLGLILSCVLYFFMHSIRYVKTEKIG